jgi:hypothetical protein
MVTTVDLAQIEQSLDVLIALLREGGPGSGNFGHEGVPGQVGGSGPGGGIESIGSSDDDRDAAFDLIRDSLEGHETSASTQEMQSASRDYAGSLLVAKDSEGRAVAALSYHVDDNILTVMHVGSISKGAGSSLIASAGKEAAKNGLSMRAEARVSARSYFEKMGWKLKSGSANVYQLSADETASIFAEGGPGSGNFGHGGREGEGGGSSGKGDKEEVSYWDKQQSAVEDMAKDVSMTKTQENTLKYMESA